MWYEANIFFFISEMNNISLIFTIIVLICFYHKSSAQESEKCECDIFQLSKNFREKNSYELTNFTKQSGVIDGRPFYYSITDEEEKILWWNVTAGSWMLQGFKSFAGGATISINEDIDCPNFSNTLLSKGSNDGEIKSSCLTDKNKCQDNGEFNKKCFCVSNYNT